MQNLWYNVLGHKIHARYLSSPSPEVTQESRSSNKPTIILVHGFIDASSQYMETLAQNLSAYFNVYIPELPGFGNKSQLRSDLRTRNTCHLNLFDLSQIMVHWMNQNNIKKAVFVGHSFGCSLITELVYRYPSYVSKCILQGPIMGNNRCPTWRQMLLLLYNNINEPVAEIPSILQNYVSCGITQSWHALSLSMKYRIEERIREIDRPTLLISSERDHVSPPEWCHNLCKLNDQNCSHIMLEGSGHNRDDNSISQLTRVFIPFIANDYKDLWVSSSSNQQLNLLHQELYSLRKLSFINLLGTLISMILFGFSDAWSKTNTLSLIILTLLLIRIVILDNRARLRKTRQLRRNIPIHPKSVPIEIPYVSKFDPNISMLQQLSNSLSYGCINKSVKSKLTTRIIMGLNYLPEWLRLKISIWFETLSAVSSNQLSRIHQEDITRDIILHYPSVPSVKRRAIAIGSANGALLHLWSAMNIPWLPQTFGILVKRPNHIGFTKRNHIHDLTAEMRWGRKIAKPLLKNNPDLQLYHTSDPNRDYLWLQHVIHLQMKLLRLTFAYQKFILDNLQPGGTIVIVNCSSKWPSCCVGGRHYFQSGTFGGDLNPMEIKEGSHRISEFIQSQNASLNLERKKKDPLERNSHRYFDWNAPKPDIHAPEAEWGFESSLSENIQEFATKHGFKVERIEFDKPRDVSPFIADFYRDWYQKYRGITTNHLLVENFILTEPFWILRRGFIPYWTEYNSESALENLEQFLKSKKVENEDNRSFHRGYSFLFSRGVKSLRMVDLHRWKDMLTDKNLFVDPVNEPFLGVDVEKYPKDFSAHVKYRKSMKQMKNLNLWSMPLNSIEFEYVKKFWRKNKEKYNVSILLNEILREK